MWPCFTQHAPLVQWLCLCPDLCRPLGPSLLLFIVIEEGEEMQLSTESHLFSKSPCRFEWLSFVHGRHRNLIQSIIVSNVWRTDKAILASVITIHHYLSEADYKKYTCQQQPNWPWIDANVYYRRHHDTTGRSLVVLQGRARQIYLCGSTLIPPFSPRVWPNWREASPTRHHQSSEKRIGWRRSSGLKMKPWPPCHMAMSGPNRYLAPPREVLQILGIRGAKSVNRSICLACDLAS